MASIIFITGAEGAGKSSILPHLKKALPRIEFHDFDEIGVPPNPTLEWRLETTRYWIRVALRNQENGRTSCIVGHVFPIEVEKQLKSKEVHNLFFCLLDLEPEARSTRLGKRNTPEMTEWNPIPRLRKEFEETKFSTLTIKTDTLTIEETALRAAEWLKTIEKNS